MVEGKGLVRVEFGNSTTRSGIFLALTMVEPCPPVFPTPPEKTGCGPVQLQKALTEAAVEGKVGGIREVTLIAGLCSCFTTYWNPLDGSLKQLVETTGPENLIFWQILKWCWPKGPTSCSKGLGIGSCRPEGDHCKPEAGVADLRGLDLRSLLKRWAER